MTSERRSTLPAPNSVDPKLRPWDASWRSRMIAGLAHPIAAYRGGLSRTVWDALTEEGRALVLDRTAPLANRPPALRGPVATPATEQAPAPAPVPVLSSASFLQCGACGAYFSTRPSRRLLAFCGATPACRPSRRRRRRRGPAHEETVRLADSAA